MKIAVPVLHKIALSVMFFKIIWVLMLISSEGEYSYMLWKHLCGTFSESDLQTTQLFWESKNGVFSFENINNIVILDIQSDRAFKQETSLITVLENHSMTPTKL